MKKLLFTLTLLAGFSTFAGEAQYRVTFKANFTKKSQPVNNFPGNPHFSPMIVASHNAHYSMYQVGSYATPGVKDVAETGKPTKLIKELEDLKSSDIVLEQQRGQRTDGTGSTSVVITVSKDHPLLSAITMIAPSPDWIVGVTGFSLVEDGDFISKRKLNLYAMDAGTDAGKYFTSKNKSNKEPISLLTNVSGKSIKEPFGTLTIEKL